MKNQHYFCLIHLKKGVIFSELNSQGCLYQNAQIKIIEG